jgi:hypothetical protein
MKRWLILLILMTCQASATVEDQGGVAASETAGVWPASSLPSLPASMPVYCPEEMGRLVLSADLAGPQSETKEKSYVTPGRSLEYIVSVKNEGPVDVEAELNIDPEGCPLDWFSWTAKSVRIPAGLSSSETLLLSPDINAVAGVYKFQVEASGRCIKSGSVPVSFDVQGYDYASETAVSGAGQFQINKDVRSMNSGIKSNKDIYFSGSVDALVKNEYLVDQAKGRNPNFEERDAVDNYLALNPGDALFGTENFKSSMAFGGIGAKFLESYNLRQMEFESQNLNLHQTGSLKKSAEFNTADNFTGYYLIDAKQIKPGQRSLKEHDEYLGSFEINRRILFKDMPTISTPSCFSSPSFASPSFSSSCNSFVNRLNAFAQSA